MSKVTRMNVLFGMPEPIKTNWGTALKWPITAEIGLMHWANADCTAITFVPSPEQDVRGYEWRAGDQAAWFRETYPQFEKINLAHSPEFEGIVTFDKWLADVAEAMTSIRKAK
jgi:hypothetical protein